MVKALKTDPPSSRNSYISAPCCSCNASTKKNHLVSSQVQMLTSWSCCKNHERDLSCSMAATTSILMYKN
jgi:hypothetical protein